MNRLLRLFHYVFSPFLGDGVHIRLKSSKPIISTNGMVDKTVLQKHSNVGVGDALLKTELHSNIFNRHVFTVVKKEFEYFRLIAIQPVFGWLQLFYLRVAICYKLLKLNYALRKNGILRQRVSKLEVKCSELFLRERDALILDCSGCDVSDDSLNGVEHQRESLDSMHKVRRAAGAGECPSPSPADKEQNDSSSPAAQERGGEGKAEA